jgi:hypothetical protein
VIVRSRLLHSFLVASLSGLVTLPVHAGSVLLFDTGGGRDVASTLGRALEAELGTNSMIRKGRPKGWKAANIGAAAKVADAARGAGVDAAVDSVLVKQGKNKALQILAVTADGDVVFDKVIRLPKKKADGVIRGVAKDLALAIAERLVVARPSAVPTPVQSPPTTGQPTKVVLEEPAPKASTAPDSSPPPAVALAAAPVSAPPSETTTTATVTPSRRGRSRSFHLALRGGAGVISYNDAITSTVDGGDLKITVAPTLLVGGGFELAYEHYFHLDLSARRSASSMTHKSEQNPLVNNVSPATIKTVDLSGTALLASGLAFGPMAVCLTAGAAYDKLDASKQSLPNADGGTDVVVLVPAGTRLEALAGITFYYGDLGTKGVAAQIFLLAVPWGQVKETPLTSGASSSLIGTQGGLRLRYQLADMMGGAGGLFFELEGSAEYLRIQFKGNGTRKSLYTNTPVQASKESRMGFAAGLGAGYLF